MHLRRVIFVCLLLPQFISGYGQDSASVNPENYLVKGMEIYGFIRGGIYAGLDQEDNNNPYVSSAFSDFGLKAGMGNGINYKAMADLRIRYGSEFREPVNRLDIREGYVDVYGKKWDWSAGQQIIKWGRADFTNPTSKLNPQNFVSRSPDRSDMDLGNLLSSVNWYPSGFLSLAAVVAPLYRPSVLLIDPIPLPENVTLNQVTSLVTDKSMLSYGLKADFHARGIDWSISWFDGYDPMPGIALTGFNLDVTGPIPVPVTDLTTTPYKIHMLGLDFELAAGGVGIRGEASWSVPYLSQETYEYVPFPEIRWVTGLDWSTGIWRVTAEYSGKAVLDFTPSAVDPVFGTEPDYAKLAELYQIPGFDPQDYVRQQVAAFNRLYNYQTDRFYHSAGIRVEADLVYGKMVPSVFTMYNFTSRDFLIIPEVKIKPADGLSITAGAEIYTGMNGSLFDIVNGFMNSVYLSLRVDF
jgi:hypothetical protein